MKFKFLLVFLIMLNLKNTLLANETVNLYDFSFEDIDGNQVNLEKFVGKPILIAVSYTHLTLPTNREV